MKERLRGFRAVYDFTFKQSASTKSFKIITTLVALLLAGGLILVNIFGAGSNKPDTDIKGEGDAQVTEISRVDNVLVIDESGLSPLDFTQFLKENKYFEHTKFETFSGTDMKEAIKDESVSNRTVILKITKENSEYVLTGALTEGSLLKGKDTKALLGALSAAFEQIKLSKAGLTADQLNAAVQTVNYTYSDIGDDNRIATLIVKMIAPMIFSFMLYFMLLFYGQTVSKSVSGEKTSKLVETLLVSVRPDALIAGKVMAVAVQGLIQFVIWIGALFAGLYGGNAIAKMLHPDYTNPVISLIDTIKNSIGQSALSLPAVILAIVFFFVGFLFYSVLAALAGSMVSKPEDAAATQSILQLPIVISWLICYFVPLSGNDSFMPIARYIPFTAPFCVPVDTLTGVVSLWESGLMLLVMLIFTIALVVLSARIFKGLILYNGQKINLKTIQGILKGVQ
ncbi:ABC transporter permease [Anaerocolumna xylanovorans]|uniref:ABC-type Na+ efflux pump, permease component n=1 Tax=Anaerocolumna xylanovorans DSM 12503 TaxID=1121345 RepID=A0A1M7Y4W1_9FIRM|nr:ABC transporter permease [Anaerocolumna xylanovorans]SHO47398.1 ABC-type Na+ efflux pump, permease component [Anaerocolumna xylanovorans DSM 12503]